MRKHSRTCPICPPPPPPGDPVRSSRGLWRWVAQAAQPPVLHLEWSAAWGGCGNKKAAVFPGRRLQDHSRRSVSRASVNLGRKQDLGGQGLSVFRWSGKRDERTMTCMQCTISFLSRPFILSLTQSRPPASFLFRAGPRRSGSSPLARPMYGLRTRCHPHTQRRHARLVWAARRRPLARPQDRLLVGTLNEICPCVAGWTHSSKQQPTPACYPQAWCC